MIKPSSSETVLQTPWFKVVAESYPSLGFTEGNPYYSLRCRMHGVVVLALTADSHVILVRQFRPAVQAYTLEMPAGAVDPGEDIESAARRELLEETGFSGGEWRYLGMGFTAVDRLDAKLHGFLATGVSLQADHQWSEEIERQIIDWAEFRRLASHLEFGQLAGLGLLLAASWGQGLDLNTGFMPATNLQQ
jgi:ADP-ribose pyrophosphatase